MNQAGEGTATVHDLYVDRINALLARGRDDEASELAVEFEAELEAELEADRTATVTVLARRTPTRDARAA